MQNKYNYNKIIELPQFYWQSQIIQKEKYRKPQKAESYLHTVVKFLLSRKMLLRGKSRRNLEFADLFTISPSHKGPTPYWPMIMIMHNGKMNPFRRLKYRGAMRHRNPLLYTRGQTAFYLFYCWNIARESLPHINIVNSSTVYTCFGEYLVEISRPRTKFNQRVLEGREKILGLEHNNTLASVSKLGLVLERQR